MEEGPWAKGGRQLWKWKDQAMGFPSRRITTLLPALLCYSASRSTPGSTLFLHRTFHTRVSWNPSEEALWVADWYEKEGNVAICSHVDGHGRHYTKRNQRKTNTVWCHLHVESKKYNKLVNKTEKKLTHRYREQASDYQWAEGTGEGKDRGRENKRVIMELYEIMCMDLLKMVKH